MMAAHFSTTQASSLLKSFDSRIDQTDPKGKITTWERVVHNGKTYYTHKAQDWREKAFFLPKVESHQLTFNIIKPDSSNVTATVYGYYHGHLIEIFLNHFGSQFSEGKASALPEPADVVKK